jgi:hypothetical protein
MYEELIEEQEAMLAAENLAGNVVKAEFHKGCLFALRLIEAYNSQQAPTNKPVESIAEHGANIGGS